MVLNTEGERGTLRRGGGVPCEKGGRWRGRAELVQGGKPQNRWGIKEEDVTRSKLRPK